MALEAVYRATCSQDPGYTPYPHLKQAAPKEVLPIASPYLMRRTPPPQPQMLCTKANAVKSFVLCLLN